jgi:hypothetical protein
MKRSTLVLNTFTNCVLLASFIFAVTVTRSAPLGNTFTYQGRLSDNGQPASGDYGMVFYLYDAPTNGNQLGNLGIVSVPVSNGLFNVTLDFGATFDGNPTALPRSLYSARASN